jgi:hypothetical protein
MQGLLGIYLNGHLVGATTGTGLARRMAASAEPGTGRAAVLSRLASESTADRTALLRIMATLGIQVRGYKVFASWARGAGQAAEAQRPPGHPVPAQ